MVDYDALLAAATTARERAYVPYSRFKVGAALLGASGTVYPGCNIENAAYPVCLCAERSACAGAWSGGETEFVALAVVADTDAPVSPCGMCRQFLFELAPDMPVLLANLAGAALRTTPRELLPGGFTKADVLK
ncbi:MAG TPA: cytidine deaminase [Herpetosiphonaceae bacterium]|nr:cytidine deaminase [Herpetosiphonaceae bacterium]